MEVVVDLLNLRQVLVLHASASLALGAVLAGVREQDLVDDDVVDVDLLLGQLDGESLRLVHGEELGNAHGDEGGLFGILKLLVHLLDLCLHAVDAVEKALLDVVGLVALLVHHGLHLGKHAPEFVLELDELDKALLEDVGEVEQAQRMPSGRRVEDDQVEVVFVERLDHLAKGGRLVDAGHARHEVLHEAHGLLRGLLVLALRHARLSEQSLEEVAALAALVGRRVHLHGEEVLEVLDLRRLVGELLVEGVAQVVRRVRRDDEYLRGSSGQREGTSRSLTLSLCLLISTAIEDEVVVLPTPPLPLHIAIDVAIINS